MNLTFRDDDDVAAAPFNCFNHESPFADFQLFSHNHLDLAVAESSLAYNYNGLLSPPTQLFGVNQNHGYTNFNLVKEIHHPATLNLPPYQLAFPGPTGIMPSPPNSELSASPQTCIPDQGIGSTGIAPFSEAWHQYPQSVGSLSQVPLQPAASSNVNVFATYTQNTGAVHANPAFHPSFPAQQSISSIMAQGQSQILFAPSHLAASSASALNLFPTGHYQDFHALNCSSSDANSLPFGLQNPPTTFPHSTLAMSHDASNSQDGQVGSSQNDLPINVSTEDIFPDSAAYLEADNDFLGTFLNVDLELGFTSAVPSSSESYSSPIQSSDDDKGKKKAPVTNKYPALAPLQPNILRSASTHKVTKKVVDRTPRKRYEEDKRKEVSHKRTLGICYHCRARRAECKFSDPLQINPDGSRCCDACKSASLLSQYFPCTVMQLSNLHMYRVSNTQRFETKFPFFGNGFGGFEVLQNSYDNGQAPITFTMTHTFFSNPLQVTVQRFNRPDNLDIPEDHLIDGKGASLLAVPYAFNDAKKAAAEIMAFIQANYQVCVREFLNLEVASDDKFTRMPLELALERCHTSFVRTYESNHTENIHKDFATVMQFWVACRCLEGGWCSGRDNLGADALPAPRWRARTRVRLPPFIEYQLQAVIMSTILTKLKQKVVAILNRWLYRPKSQRARAALDTFLLTFVVMHSYEIMFDHDATYAQRRSISNDMYVDYDLIQRLYGGAHSILLLFHYQHKDFSLFYPNKESGGPDGSPDEYICNFDFLSHTEKEWAIKYANELRKDQTLPNPFANLETDLHIRGSFTKCLALRQWTGCFRIPEKCPQKPTPGMYPLERR